MTLIEAMRSGRRFKRPHHENWYEVRNNTVYPTDAILADDWELETEVLSITWDQLHLAINQCGLGIQYLNPTGSKLRTTKIWEILHGSSTTTD